MVNIVNWDVDKLDLWERDHMSANFPPYDHQDPAVNSFSDL